MCSGHSILECCVMFSGVKLSMGSFVLFQNNSVLYFFPVPPPLFVQEGLKFHCIVFPSLVARLYKKLKNLV